MPVCKPGYCISTGLLTQWHPNGVESLGSAICPELNKYGQLYPCVKTLELQNTVFTLDFLVHPTGVSDICSWHCFHLSRSCSILLDESYDLATSCDNVSEQNSIQLDTLLSIHNALMISGSLPSTFSVFVINFIMLAQQPTIKSVRLLGWPFGNVSP